MFCESSEYFANCFQHVSYTGGAPVLRMNVGTGGGGGGLEAKKHAQRYLRLGPETPGQALFFV